MHKTLVAGLLGAVVGLSVPCLGQVLYSQNFDTDDSANWNIVDGPTDELAEFFWNYSSMGIPAAPTTAAGTTRGMRLRANLSNGIFGGFNVSPKNQSFTGVYTLKFDWWSNFIGPLNTGASGSTMISTFGVLTSGTAGNFPSAASPSDSVYFAATGDGQSAFDYRAYSVEQSAGYHAPPIDAEDAHATFLAGSQNNSAPYYTANFPGGLAAPALQQATYPSLQTNTTPAGSMGFKWHQVEIELNSAGRVTWTVDGVPLIYIETFPFFHLTGGNNIFFGHSDTNATVGTHPAYGDLTFTLIDNVSVVQNRPGDANLDGKVDITDLAALATHWQQAGAWRDGDFNDSGFVDISDLASLATNWQFGAAAPLAMSFEQALATVGLGGVAVPEPGTVAILLGIIPAIAQRRKR